MSKAIRHGNRGIHILSEDGFPQEIRDNRAINRVALHQRIRNADKAAAAFHAALVQLLAAHDGHRKEGRASRVVAFEILNGSLRRLLVRHDDLLHGAAKGDLDSDGVAVVGADQLGDRSVNAAQKALCTLLHDDTHRFGKALIFALHLLKEL